MFKWIPRPIEFVLLAVLAIYAAVVLGLFGVHEKAFLAAGFPLCLCSMLLGARRGGHLNNR